MAAIPVTLEQMQQFTAEVDGCIAAAKAESEAHSVQIQVPLQAPGLQWTQPMGENQAVPYCATHHEDSYAPEWTGTCNTSNRVKGIIMAFKSRQVKMPLLVN